MKFGQMIKVLKEGFHQNATGIVTQFDGGGTYVVELITKYQLGTPIEIDLQESEMELIEENT